MTKRKNSRSSKPKSEKPVKPTDEVVKSLPDTEGCEPDPEEQPKKKVVTLKQYLVWGSKNPEDSKAERKAFFILATCAINARKEFEEKTGMKVTQCMQTAESQFTKDDLPKHDFWKEKQNWELELGPEKEMSASAKAYFEMKDRAEKVQAAKRELGIKDWESATEEQLTSLHKLLDAQKGS